MARPKGSENKDKPFREALRLELAAIGEDQKALRRIARNLIKLAGGDAEAIDGGLAAIKEIADRLDGKPAQAIENGEGGAFEVSLKASKEQRDAAVSAALRANSDA